MSPGNDCGADGMRFEDAAELRLSLMSQSDRRQGRISVQELRRDLREADEDRFRLTAALTPRRSSSSGGIIIGVLFLLVAGFISALWTSRGSAPADGLVSAATPETVAPAVVEGSERRIEATLVEAPAKPRPQIRHSTVVETPVAKPPRRIRRSTNNARGQVAHTQMVERRHPHVARPLHPGQFGRLPSSDRRTGAPILPNR
jgi:hypothetical protein